MNGGVRQVVIVQPWPWELARDWLGVEEPPQPAPLPEHVRALLETASPLLNFAEIEQSP
ncbi:hypothetical protein [Streptomyces collinus]|uniref:hypothetical protein n=1 Tax=Streptomyces collinus TaxID=42684 RepID=UPI003632553D